MRRRVSGRRVGVDGLLADSAQRAGVLKQRHVVRVADDPPGRHARARRGRDDATAGCRRRGDQGERIARLPARVAGRRRGTCRGKHGGRDGHVDEEECARHGHVRFEWSCSTIGTADTNSNRLNRGWMLAGATGVEIRTIRSVRRHDTPQMTVCNGRGNLRA